MAKKSNKQLKKVYKKIFKKGYTKVYTVNTRSLRDAINKNLKLTPEMAQALKAANWRGKRVLEIGCGTGVFAYAVATRGAKVLAVDYVKEAIDEAKNTYQHKNLEFKVGDTRKISGKFDIVVSLGTLEHLDNPLKELKKFKSHLRPVGRIITTCPNWTNPRGYVLQTLLHLFDAPITLADLHYLTPLEFKEFADKLKMKLEWRTFDHDWAHGKRLIKDFKRRLPNVLRDAKLPRDPNNIKRFIKWLENHVLPLDHTSPFSGATAIYVLK